MSQSTLQSAIESAVKMSEAAVAAGEEAMAAARLASIHATSALAAAKLALDLVSQREREGGSFSRGSTPSLSSDLSAAKSKKTSSVVQQPLTSQGLKSETEKPVKVKVKVEGSKVQKSKRMSKIVAKIVDSTNVF